MTDHRGSFNSQQVRQLLQPIHPSRVLRDGKGHSHVSQQDVTAHLVRVFGFGGFDVETVTVECVFETPRDDQGRRYDVCYRALVRLTVRDPEGRTVGVYEDGSTATAQNQTRGDAHDLAYKSALSLAKKRAAINLGDQFGLSLYNKGQMEALVRGTLVDPNRTDEPAGSTPDVQDGVPQQVSLGNDETSYEHEDQPTEQPAPAQRGTATRQQGRSKAQEAPAAAEPPPALRFLVSAQEAKTLDALKGVYQEATAAGVLHDMVPSPSGDGDVTILDFISRRKARLEALPA